MHYDLTKAFLISVQGRVTQILNNMLQPLPVIPFQWNPSFSENFGVKPHSHNNALPCTVTHIHIPYTHLAHSDLATCAWGCLTLENNGMSSWLYSRVWRAYSTGVGVSNVARLYGCDPGLGGTAGSLPLAARPFQTAVPHHHRVMNYLSSSSHSDVNA